MLTQTEISQDDNGIATIKLAGRFTLGNSMSLADSKINQCIETMGARRLIFDLTGLTLIDSAGLGLIVFTHGRLRNLAASFASQVRLHASCTCSA